jgi:TP901 family phage tail tape measure protein
MPIQIPVVQTGLERSIQEAATKAGKNLRINMGPGAKSIDALSRPLGRLTGKADEFTKSMEAANARVLAFGASVGVIAAVSRGFQELVRTTIDVEKNLANINSILKQSESQLNSFKDTIFDIARNTGQTFGTVAEAALELSRQGLKAEEVTKRLNDALVLSRLSGLSAADSVSGLTAAINSFSSAGITSEQVLNKISAAAASAAVSDRDLIEGLKRSGSVAVASGVQFDELIGIIGALQERTARGGAVIGNSLKTIFVRIQDIEKLKTLQGLGVQVTDLEGKVLSSSKVIENLGPVFAKLSQTAKVNLADDLVGKFQIAPFLALLEDYNQKVSRSGEIAATSFNATNEAYQRNEALSKTLAAAINTATVNLKELANALGEIGVTENLSKIIGVFNSVVSSIQGILDGDGIGSQFAKGLIKGIGSIIAGPGLALALVAIGKLLLDFAKFGSGALKTFFGLNSAAEAQKNLQGQIAASLLNDKGIRSAILSIEKQNISEGEKKKLQTLFFTGALNEQLMLMKKMQGIAISIAPGVMKGTALASGGKNGRAAGGFLPIGAERSDISKGVGGSPSSAKPVVIPNFAFGGGRRGTMVANDSEYIVPNYANGGDAIFNQNMASSMGLPANARKVRAAGGYIPNFANAPVPLNEAGKYVMMHGQKGSTNPNKLAYRHPDGKFNTVYKEGARPIKVPVYGLSDQYKGKDVDSFIKDLELYSYKKAIKEAKSLSGGQMPNPIKQGSIKAHINKGAVAGFAGSIYELSLATLLTDEEFLAYSVQTDTSNFDLNLTGQKGLLDLYNIDTKPEYGEVKGRNNPDNVASAAAKIYRVLEKGELAQTSKLVGKYLPKNLAKELGFNVADRSGRYLVKNSDLEKLNASGRKFSTSREGIISASSASGYIPNFAEGALENAIAREKGAGLPVNQIRINQSGKLRNSQNPMGLAVTNTRDEPTGAIPAARGFIPNYSSPFPTGTPQHPATQQLEKVGNAAEGASKELNKNSKGLSKNTNTSDGLTGKFFAIQTGLSLFGSGLSEASKEAEGVTGFLASLAQGAATATQVLFAMQAFGIKPGFNKGSEKSGKRTAANVQSRLTFGAENTKLYENTRKLGGGIGAVAGGFMRFLPVIGAVTTGLMLLDPVIKKMFGTGIFEGIGRALGLVQSPAEKAAKALNDLADKAVGDLFQGKGDKNFMLTLKAAIEKSNQTGKPLEEVLKETPEQRAAETFNQIALEAPKQKIDTELGAPVIAAPSNEVSRIVDAIADAILPKWLPLANPIQITQSVGGVPFGEGENSDRFRAAELLVQKAENLTLLSQLSEKDQQNLINQKPDQIAAILKKKKSQNLAAADQAYRDRAQNPNLIASDELPSQRFQKKTTDAIFSSMRGQTSPFKGLNDMLTALDKAKQAGTEQKVKEGTLTEGPLGIVQLQNSLALAKQESIRTTELDKQIESARTLGSLNEKGLRALTDTKEIEELTNKLDEEKLSTLDAQLAKVDALYLNSQELRGIQGDMEAAAKLGLITDEKIVGLAERLSILGVDALAMTDSEKEILNKQLSSLTVKADIEKRIKEGKQEQKNLDEISLRNLQQKNVVLSNNLLLEKQSTENRLASAKLANQKTADNLNLNIGDSTNTARAEQARNIAVAKDEKRLQLGSDAVASRKQSSFSQAGIDAKSMLEGFSGVDLSEKKKKKLNAQVVNVKDEASFNDFIKGLENLVPKGKNSNNFKKQLDGFSNQSIEGFKTREATLAQNLENNIDTASILRDSLFTVEKRLGRMKDGEVLDDSRMQAQAQAQFDAENLRNAGLTRQAAIRSEDSKFIDQYPKLPPELAIQVGSMNRGVSDRIAMGIPDALQSSDQLKQSLADASTGFAHNIGDAMLDAIAKGESLGDALKAVGIDFLNTISKAFMNKAVNDMMGMFFPTPPIKAASGGPISGGSGHKDDIPAMLMGGEFVMNKKSVKKYGMGFMSALNNGSLQGFASGGQVRDEEGMFTTPGMNGAGAIKGAANLLSFATQTPTALNRDTTTDNGAFLDSESGRMTMFGKRNNPEFQKVQDAKQQAFDLYGQELAAKEQAKEQEKEAKKQLMKSLKGAVKSAAISAGVSSMVSGYKAGSESAGGSWWNKFKGGTKGMLFGGNEIGGQSYGGLTNILSGTGFMSGPPKAYRVNDEGFSGSSSSTSKGGGLWSSISKGWNKIFNPTADRNQIYNTDAPVYGTPSGGPEDGDFALLPRAWHNAY